MKIEKLSPAFKDYLWGGTKLRDVYGKNCDYDKVAESWELSTHPAGQSIIEGGEHDYYVLFYLFTVTESIPEGYYRDVFVPLPAEIADLIPEG